MRVDEFDFELPEDLIALRPARPRDTARMLIVGPQPQTLVDRIVRDLPDYLRKDDILIFNDTRVIPARLFGVRKRADAEAKIEALLHKRIAGDTWQAFVRPAKRLKLGEQVEFTHGLSAKVEERGEGGQILFRFSESAAALDEAIARAGEMPLPPYIARKRAADDADLADYQTIYADRPGAVAAPTAGLHFTPALMSAVEACGVATKRITLHVGAGTFLPVTAEDTEAHKMHSEWGEIPEEVADAINAAKAKGGRVIPVGTTSMRLLEAAVSETGILGPFSGDTDIFITPGKKIRIVDILMTNFHLPRSTLFMLVSALRGTDEMKRAYAHAISQKYRFYSYGDTSLIYRAGLE
tara:strand:- start:102135 stop:103193 length:1059 start_codon:yes stop_codon:yes gene_type:complete